MRGNKMRDKSLQDAIDEYTAFVGTPSYKESVRTMFKWAKPFLKDRRAVTVGDITVRDCREFSKHLARQSRAEEISAASANTYYDVFRAWLSFCVRDEMISQNPAATRRAEEMLPDDTSENDQQFWSKEARTAILDAADDYAERALDEITESGWACSFRNRCITYIYSYSAGRLTEIVASSKDEERNGICWSDVDLEEGSIRVLGKNREYEYMQLPSAPAAVLDEYRQIVEPASDDWPVFPSAHGPSLHRAARRQLRERGLDEDEREELLEENVIYDVYREEGLVPPPLTNSGFKQGFWYDFTDEYDLKIDGERPEIHGARRGLGDELYREAPQLAQSALRHRNIGTTHNAYSNIQAGETADDVDEALGSDAPQSFLQEGDDD